MEMTVVLDIADVEEMEVIILELDFQNQYYPRSIQKFHSKKLLFLGLYVPKFGVS